MPGAAVDTGPLVAYFCASEARLLLENLARAALRIALRLDAEAVAVRDLMNRCSNIPMSLASACLVRLAELSGLPVRTLDSNFTLYRVPRNTRLSRLMP